jgi:homoserine kinase type II
MAQFRSLLATDVQEMLAGFAAGAAGAYVAHQPIAAGTVNTNLRVDTTTGPRFLRINEGKREADVLREADIVTYLAARGTPTPAPARAASGEPFVRWRGELVSLFPWVPGRVLPRAEVGPLHARDVGRALATVHVEGASFPDHGPGRYETDEIERRLARLAASPADAAVADAVASLAPELAALGTARRADLPRSLIHGDLFIDNVLYDGDALVALIDFEQASWGMPAYDLAVTLLAFAFGRDDFRPEVTRALIEGYCQRRPVLPGERDGFGAELRFAACRFTVTRITDVYLRRGQGAPPGKDFHRYLLRLDRVKAHLAAADGLLSLP